METSNVLRNVFAPLLATAILLAAGPAFAQAQERTVAAEAEAVARPVTCPAPFSVTLDAKTPYVLTSDIGSIKNYQTSLGSPQKPDTAYLHTFVWKHERRCCQVTSAVLTVQMKALLPGQSTSSNDAGNDDISIIHAGVPVPPHNERVYTHPPVNFPFAAGQTATKVWSLSPAALGLLNANGYLTLYVEDDTMVQSATLQLSGCCLTN
ncbi:MAG TPA: hypothetical protein VFC23_04765 [Thermoanaerobaculia bacterium]|nr:hypothetical protein [Thermoanaerobaculia bacterium]